jgi:hypothetical protein
MIQKVLNTTVVGFRHQTPPQHPHILSQGIISYQKEPKNKHDINAVKVLVDGVHVGYISNTNNKNFPDEVISTEVSDIYSHIAKIQITYNITLNNDTCSYILRRGYQCGHKKALNSNFCGRCSYNYYTNNYDKMEKKNDLSI